MWFDMLTIPVPLLCVALAFRLFADYVSTMKSNALVVSNPGVLDGTPVFAGTRVPIKALTDYLEAGDSLDAFLEDFPTVTRAQTIAFLEEARECVVSLELAHAQ